MSLARFMLRPIARLAGWHANAQARAFLAAHRHTARVQEELLGRLVQAGAASDFGRRHALERVRNYDDFAAAVPVGDYESHRPYIDRVLAGDVSALFPPQTPITMFAVTSGTTGAPKHIPITPRFLADYHRGWNIFGIMAFKAHPAAWLRKVLTITSSCCDWRSPRGLPCGAISGLLAQEQKWIVRRMYPVPPSVREVRDSTVKLYCILRAALTHDVGFLTTANPSSVVALAETAVKYGPRLIADIHDGVCRPPGELPPEVAASLRSRPNRAGARRLERILRQHGELAPRHVWKLGLLCHWTGGTVGLYLPLVRRHYGDVPIRDIGLLASEGRFSVPLEDGTPAGVAEITSHFLEFLPVGEAPGAARLPRAHELEEGREYFLVVTNWAGLWRYNLDDRVRVVGRLGDSPIIEFLSRGLHTVSITGEKLTEHQVVQAMQRTGLAVELFELQGRFAQPPHYELRIEPPPGARAEEVARQFDAALRHLNVEYDGKRSSGRLGPVRPVVVFPGSFARRQQEQIALRRGRGEQYKHKYLLTEVVTEGSPR